LILTFINTLTYVNLNIDNMSCTNKSTKSGFTLVEIMIAIGILSVLSSIGISRYIGAQQSGQDSKRKSDVDSIANAYETNYDFVNKIYSPLTSTDFSDGFPKQPTGSDYVFVEGPGSRNPDITPSRFVTDTYMVCGMVGATCYCRKSPNKAPSSTQPALC
jgi:prepilin-type N-terminal cleavage/methylation domain-containing protein